MPQYVIIAHDGGDEDALNRRMAARPGHFARARSLKAAGQFIAGGAILNGESQMNGSVMIVEFETEEELQNWLREEPYVTENVWKDITVFPFRLADV